VNPQRGGLEDHGLERPGAEVDGVEELADLRHAELFLPGSGLHQASVALERSLHVDGVFGLQVRAVEVVRRGADPLPGGPLHHPLRGDFEDGDPAAVGQGDVDHRRAAHPFQHLLRLVDGAGLLQDAAQT
jgi:hypothetical protein